MTKPPPQEPHDDVDSEDLTRRLLETIEFNIRTHAQDLSGYQELTKQSKQFKIYTKINASLGKFGSLAESMEPREKLFQMLREILPLWRNLLEADHIFLLKQVRQQNPQQLQIVAQSIAPEKDTWSASAEHITYNFQEETWNSFGNHQGFAILQYTPVDAGHGEEYRSNRLKEGYHLPMPNETAEVVILRVGDFHRENEPNTNIKFVLVIHRLDSSGAEINYRDDIPLVFPMLSVRLNEIYNLVLRRLAALKYDEDRARFMEDVMHQLSGSLSAISIMVENLIDGTAENPDDTLQRLYEITYMFRHYTKTFALAAQQRSILNVYQEEPVEFTGQDWIDLLHQFAGFFKNKADYDGIQGPNVVTQSFANFPKVSVRKGLVELLIFNLIDNAVKYSVKKRNSPIILDGIVTDGGAQLRVHNFGVGIAEEDQQRIFERYFRSDRVRKIEANGTGVGLYICKRIMETHGGRVAVTSAPSGHIMPDQNEVIFRAEFPSIIGKYEQEEQDLPELESELPIILFVEDEPWLHRELIVRLEQQYIVYQARSGRRALDILRERGVQIDLILLDVNLSDPDDSELSGPDAGVELARRIFKLHQSNIPVIGWTGQTATHIHEQLLQLGVKQVIHRTQMSGRELVQTIDKYLKE